MTDIPDNARKCLEDAARRNLVWLGRQMSIRPVSGGLTNSNYSLKMEGVDTPIFAKIPGAGTEEFIDRRASHDAAVQAADLGLSPNVLFFDERTGIEFSEFLVHGYRTATTFDFQTPTFFERVIRLYRKLHCGPLLPQTKTMLDMVDEHLQQVEGENIKMPEWFGQLRNEYEDLRGRFLSTGLELVPAHNDPMPGNFLIGDNDDLVLLDFDYAANNELTYEIGVISAEMFASRDLTKRLVAAYAGEVTERLYSRVMVCRAIADIKWGLWGLINHHVKNEDFDYYKYGVWKLHRSTQILQDREYESWKAAV